MTVVAVACVAAWLGIMAFFSFGVAPLAFALMERTAAGQVVVAVLPRYYITGLGLCAVALVVYAAQAAGGRGGRLRPLAGVVLCAAMMGMLAWAATVLTPRAEAARRTRDDIAFARAHRACRHPQRHDHARRRGRARPRRRQAGAEGGTAAGPAPVISNSTRTRSATAESGS